MRKSYSLFLGVTLKKEVVDEDDDDDGWEPVEPILSSCDSVLGYWEFSGKKSV